MISNVSLSHSPYFWFLTIFSYNFRLIFIHFTEFILPHFFIYLETNIYKMDVFIPEEYVTRRRFEKKAAPATCGKGSKSHSNRNSNRIEVTKNKASSSNKGFGLVGDNFIFTCFSA
ncbi:hypothetical protein Lalb_Chr09g0333311 [Lupinus albus]|uniref:Uncharacterized protein n=1 Tax=Lupinus albus TaxID=3870 RepID=A0A6A4Q2J6_LUPAL|nr:hypothetical protein Lalb_Chr09g0333311 [Lupinus albus]